MRQAGFLLFLSLFVGRSAEAVQINYFDDLNAATVNGLVHGGVTYSFTAGGMPSNGALYGVPFTPDSLIGSTVLAGTAGDAVDPSNFSVLSLNFDAPTSTLSFSIALASGGDDSFLLLLLDSLNNPLTPAIVTTRVDASCDSSVSSCLSEAQYTYAGAQPISQAALSFSHTQAGAFAIGTLITDEVPEPGSLWLFATGGALLFALSRRFQLAMPLSRANDHVPERHGLSQS